MIGICDPARSRSSVHTNSNNYATSDFFKYSHHINVRILFRTSVPLILFSKVWNQGFYGQQDIIFNVLSNFLVWSRQRYRSWLLFCTSLASHDALPEIDCLTDFGVGSDWDILRLLFLLRVGFATAPFLRGAAKTCAIGTRSSYSSCSISRMHTIHYT